jgi:uncharacterized membrane protein YgcG
VIFSPILVRSSTTTAFDESSEHLSHLELFSCAQRTPLEMAAPVVVMKTRVSLTRGPCGLNIAGTQPYLLSPGGTDGTGGADGAGGDGGNGGGSNGGGYGSAATASYAISAFYGVAFIGLSLLL